ncbi:MAG: hypothetical protein J3K34DRAFT_483631 [Monoraphidium minutum]|nr:MAG: hypothetical protein J3K34DRAFT_483631 [Monoraphidium minutum]
MSTHSSIEYALAGEGPCFGGVRSGMVVGLPPPKTATGWARNRWRGTDVTIAPPCAFGRGPRAAPRRRGLQRDQCRGLSSSASNLHPARLSPNWQAPPEAAAPRRLSATLELLAGGGDSTRTAQITVGAADVLAALRAAAPGLLGGGGAPASAHLAAAEVFSTADATHAVYAGGIHPLHRGTAGVPYILAPSWTEVPAGGLGGAGSRLLRLTPCGSAEERLDQLRALGALVREGGGKFGSNSYGGDTEPLHDSSGARKHVILLPDGDLVPVFGAPGHFVAAPPFAPSASAEGPASDHKKLIDVRSQCAYQAPYPCQAEWVCGGCDLCVGSCKA